MFVLNSFEEVEGLGIFSLRRLVTLLRIFVGLRWLDFRERQLLGIRRFLEELLGGFGDPLLVVLEEFQRHG